MAEQYPDDGTLLTLSADDATGVEYIPTGQSPYYLSFRQMLYRLLRVAERANDFRPYVDGDLSIGVRGGRCYLNGTAIDFAGASNVAISASATVYVWLDGSGAVQTGSGLPTDRTAFLPIAQVTAESNSIDTLEDLRGEAFLQLPTLAMLGLTPTAAQVNQVLAGLNGTVDAAALNTLCGGYTTTADQLHRHARFQYNLTGEATFAVENDSTDSSSTVGLMLSLPSLLPASAMLLVDTSNGYLRQRYGLSGEGYQLVGTVHGQFAQEGALTGSLSGKLMGVVPIDGVVSGVILSLGSNLASSNSGDGISATAKVNGTAEASTDPSVTTAAGSGFVSTAQGAGTAGVIKSDGTEQVKRGDVLSVDITRSVSGTVSSEASDVVVMVVIRANQPE